MKFVVEYGSPEYYEDKKWNFGLGLVMILVAEFPSLLLGFILVGHWSSDLFAAGVVAASFIIIFSVLFVLVSRYYKPKAHKDAG